MRALALLVCAAPLLAQGPPPYRLPSTIVPQSWYGLGAPGAVPGNLPGDFYYDLSQSPVVQYFCAAPYRTGTTITVAPACSTVAAGQWQREGSGGSGSSASFEDFRAGCQSTIGGSNFDSASGVGTQATRGNCDTATGSLDSFISFPAGSTTHIQGHTYLSSTFVDGISAKIADWNTTATSGAAVFGIAWQCVAVGGLASTGGYGSYTTWNSSTAQATASHRNSTNTLTLTTGCAPDSMLYFDIELTSGNNTLAGSAAAQLKWLRLGITQ